MAAPRQYNNSESITSDLNKILAPIQETLNKFKNNTEKQEEFLDHKMISMRKQEEKEIDALTKEYKIMEYERRVMEVRSKYKAINENLSKLSHHYKPCGECGQKGCHYDECKICNTILCGKCMITCDAISDCAGIFCSNCDKREECGCGRLLCPSDCGKQFDDCECGQRLCEDCVKYYQKFSDEFPWDEAEKISLCEDCFFF